MVGGIYGHQLTPPEQVHLARRKAMARSLMKTLCLRERFGPLTRGGGHAARSKRSTCAANAHAVLAEVPDLQERRAHAPDPEYKKPELMDGAAQVWS